MECYFHQPWKIKSCFLKWHLNKCFDVLLSALRCAESWLGTSAIFIWRRLLRKQGWRKGWGDGWRRTRVDRLSEAYTNTGSTTAAWEVLHHPCKRLSASLTGFCFWKTPSSPPRVFVKNMIYDLQADRSELFHPSAHRFHSQPALSGFIWKTANICLSSVAVNSCCRRGKPLETSGKQESLCE